MTTTILCPRCDDTEVEVVLAYEPPDPSYGSDADGRRGVYVPGYWYVESVAETCDGGCTLTAEEYRVAEERAEVAARDYEVDEVDCD